MTAQLAAPTAQRRDIFLDGGLRLRYLEQGDPHGPAVLLLHGYGDSSVSFDRILPLLPDSWRVIAPDHRGHGNSDRPAGGYRPDDFARDAIALLDALGIDEASVVGHSMGSLVAQRLAWLAPERVRRLVLIGSGASCRNQAVEGMRSAVEALTDPVDVEFIREFQQGTIHRPVPSEFFERIVAESRKLPARVWRAALAGMIETDFAADLPKLRCPTLILWGDRDAIFCRSDQEELMRLVPRATLRIYSDVGHDPQWEIPDECARDLEEWLS